MTTHPPFFASSAGHGSANGSARDLRTGSCMVRKGRVDFERSRLEESRTATSGFLQPPIRQGHSSNIPSPLFETGQARQQYPISSPLAEPSNVEWKSWCPSFLSNGRSRTAKKFLTR